MPEELGRTVEESYGPIRPGPRKPPAEVEEHARIADKAAERARAIQQTCSGDDPHLGLATTEDLIVELHARMVVQLAQPDHRMDLHYRTIDGDGVDITRSVTGEEDSARLEERASELLAEANRIRRDPAREAQRG